MGRIYRNILCPAKVNLILRIDGPDEKGYHPLESLMVKLNWGDRITLRVSRALRTKIRLKESVDLGIPPEKNLVYRAAAGFCQTYDCALDIEASLRKVVPLGAGLGGGSSDAAQTLKLLWSYVFGRSPFDRKLYHLAASLGSDIPFFLGPSGAWCTGYGEKLKPLKLCSFELVLVFPRTAISTPWAYRELDRWREATGVTPRLRDGPSWTARSKVDVPELENDFEGLVFGQFAEVRRAHQALSKAGALAARMSGSGSTVFGVFRTARQSKKAEKRLRSSGWQARVCRTL